MMYLLLVKALAAFCMIRHTVAFNAQAVDGDNINLSCNTVPNPSFIQVLSSNYGGPGCPGPKDTATSGIASICDGQSHCSIGVDSRNFGILDPCLHTKKMLTVNYQCVPYKMPDNAGDASIPDYITLSH